MRALKLSIAVAVLSVALAAPSFAQTPGAAAQQPPAQPPAQGAPKPAQPPTQAAPKPAPQPPAPFPQDAKMAFINIQEIAASSSAGKDASNKLKALNDKKVAEINDKNKQLQAQQTKLNTGGSVLSETARAALEKDIDRLQRDIQFSQQNAQAEMNELQQDLQGEFQKKLIPIIEAVAKEKGLQAVFSVGDSGVAYFEPGLDISQEIVKRLDAGAAPVKK